MNEPSLDYLAGFFDGEGSISAMVAQVARNGRRHPDLFLRVVVVNTHPAIPEAFRARFGGHVWTSKATAQHRALHRWTLAASRPGLTAFVEAMSGRLVIKALQLDILRRYLAETHARGNGEYTVADAEYARRLDFARELRTANAVYSGRAKAREDSTIK